MRGEGEVRGDGGLVGLDGIADALVQQQKICQALQASIDSAREARLIHNSHSTRHDTTRHTTRHDTTRHTHLGIVDVLVDENGELGLHLEYGA